MQLSPTYRIAFVAAAVYLTDQVSKRVVMNSLDLGEQCVLLPGFFKLVHWGNTGAAFSMFNGNNGLLALVSLAAMAVLLLTRRHFEIDRPLGQLATGLILGGILGNLTDRLLIGHVVDFLYFHLHPRGGGEIGFPAFNVADSAICIGVGLLFVLSFTSEASTAKAADKPA
jgi:signal peptidase II